MAGLGWVAWLVRLQGVQKNRSLSLKMSRNTIRVLDAFRFVCRAHYPHCVTCIGIGVAMSGLDFSILGAISLILICGIIMVKLIMLYACVHRMPLQ